jgi:trans-aconitate 2-methyltransferase
MIWTMTSPSWNPEKYLDFAAERARPFDDLVARIATPDPVDVVDLGCGPGNVTRTLLGRWPNARVHGIDSSADMIDRAARVAAGAPAGRLTFSLGDVRTWEPQRSLDVIVANAVLHWVPEHMNLLPRWVGALRPGGSLAFQMPGNAAGEAAAAVAEVTASPRWAGAFAEVATSGGLAAEGTTVREPAAYADELGALGCVVDAWETTYVHVLAGEDPVLEWYSGTGLRPYFDRLEATGGDLDALRADLAASLRAAFPPRPYGTQMPFRRVFVVARRP